MRRHVAIDAALEEGIDFLCPFCGKHATTGYINGDPVVVHTEPACEKFLACEPDEFLAQVNDKMGHKR